MTVEVRTLAFGENIAQTNFEKVLFTLRTLSHISKRKMILVALIED